MSRGSATLDKQPQPQQILGGGPYVGQGNLFIEGIYLADYSEFGFLEGCPVLRAATLKKVTVLDVGGDVDWGLLL